MSSKEPKQRGKKSKLVRNVALTALGFALFLSFLAAFSFEEIKAPSGEEITQLSNTNHCNGLYIKDICYTLEKATTNEARIKGLSDRDKLSDQSAMLFVFDNPSEQCMWMKDMRFNLDIVWLDDEKKVIKIEKDVSPATYPNSFCSQNTKYVLEFNSGETSKLQLAINDQLSF